MQGLRVCMSSRHGPSSRACLPACTDWRFTWKGGSARVTGWMGEGVSARLKAVKPCRGVGSHRTQGVWSWALGVISYWETGRARAFRRSSVGTVAVGVDGRTGRRPSCRGRWYAASRYRSRFVEDVTSGGTTAGKTRITYGLGCTVYMLFLWIMTACSVEEGVVYLLL